MLFFNQRAFRQAILILFLCLSLSFSWLAGGLTTVASADSATNSNEVTTRLAATVPEPEMLVSSSGTRNQMGQTHNVVTIGGNCAEADLDNALNIASSGDTIVFSCGNQQTSIFISSQKVISKNLVIDGSAPGANRTGQGGIVKLMGSGPNPTRVFSVTTGINFTLQNITVSGGQVRGAPDTNTDGGGLSNNGGIVTISNTVFSGNNVIGGGSYSGDGGSGSGGAVSNNAGGNLTIYNSRFNQNNAYGGSSSSTGIGGAAYGGAVSNNGGTVTVIGSSFEANNVLGGFNYSGVAGSGGYGGGFYNSTNGTAVISSTTFSQNTATAGNGYSPTAGNGYGGGLNNSGVITLTYSSFENNKVVGGRSNNGNGAKGFGGGIANTNGGSLTLISSNLLGNDSFGGGANYNNVRGDGFGGAIANIEGTLVAANATISGNTAQGGTEGNSGNYGNGVGGGIYNNSATTTLVNDDLVNNAAATGSGNGDNVYSTGNNAQVAVANTIVTTNTSTGNCSAVNGGSIPDSGYNLEYSGPGKPNNCNFTNHAQTGDPELSSLQYNGYASLLLPLRTLALLAGSPAIDAGNDNLCAASPVNKVDERGFARPGGSHCDIGSYELTYSNYNLPLLANNATTAVGQTTTYITFQNSGTNTASVTVQYYSITDGSAGPSEVITIPTRGQKAILPNIPTGSSYGGTVKSDQPLNLVVSEALGRGGSAYNVAASTASTLYSPLALNGQYNFTTRIIVFNTGTSGSSSGNIQFFDEQGNQSGQTQAFNIPAHASRIFDQSAVGSGLTANHAYWAKITADNPANNLTSQVIEFGPNNFVATFNAIVPSQLQSTLYAPAIFNGQFNFVTGLALANPNNVQANVSIKYYDVNGVLLLTQSVNIAANGTIGVFQPNVSGLSNRVSSATIISTQPLIMAVNERGPGAVSGTYTGLATGKNLVSLPVIANGFAGFVTGATILNIGSSSALITLLYFDQAGNHIDQDQTQILAPNASFQVFQGDGNQNLPSNFFGTAIVGSDQPVLVTTNALNTSSGLFYTYTEPTP